MWDRSDVNGELSELQCRDIRDGEILSRVWGDADKMSKMLEKYGPAVGVIPLIVVDVILLLLVFPATAVGWISLVLLNVACFAFFGAFRIASQEAGRVFGLQLRYIASGYLLIELAVTLLVLAIPGFEHWLNDRFGIYLVFTLLVTGLFAALYIGAFLVQRRSGAELAYQRENLAFGKVAAARLDRIKALSPDAEFTVKLRSADDAIRFSLVEWAPAARALEGQIIDELDQVQACLESGDVETATVKARGDPSIGRRTE